MHTKVSYTDPVIIVEFNSRSGKVYEILLSCEFHEPTVTFGEVLIDKFSNLSWICDECWLQSMQLLRRHKRRYG